MSGLGLQKSLTDLQARPNFDLKLEVKTVQNPRKQQETYKNVFHHQFEEK